MNPPLNLTDADAQRRAKAATLLASMRGNLDALEHYLAAVPALPGNMWIDTVIDADLAVIRAVKSTTNLGSSNLWTGK